MKAVLVAALAVATWYDPQVLMDQGGLPACYGTSYPHFSVVGADGFVAVDAGMLLSEVVECGEILAVYYTDYNILHRYVVWDMGPLMSYGHYIEDYHDLPYMLDVTSEAWPVALDGLLSARVMIVRSYKLPRERREGVY